jgi:D-sedoheptulose 7-phosphate isomerase
MSQRADIILNILIKKYPAISEIKSNIKNSYELIKDSYNKDGKLLVCGNGGSSADAEHIVGELMKGFLYKRRLNEQNRMKLISLYLHEGKIIADKLQGALPAISLVSQTSLLTAYGNDIDFDMVFAQQVYGYGRPGDVLLGISTSGNSKNILNAVKVAKAFDIGTICLTGKNGGLVEDFCDIIIKAPASDTPSIQEYHLPIYHTLCEMLETEFYTE